MEPESPSSRETFPRFANAVIGVAFAVVATTVAIVRFRTSPLYPTYNDINSDVYVYQIIGNSWTHGLLPYRDVYDIKGPFLFLLFGLFARIRPWSMGPPLVVLTLLAFMSVWLAYAIARLYNLRRSIAAVSAVSSILLIYLSVMSVESSFTCAELAVPAILLMLWLTLCWLQKGTINAWWWMIDGVLLGALFWSKYLVIIPWVGILLASVVLVIRGQILARDLRRVIFLHLIGVAIASALILPFYAAILPDMLRGYFLAASTDLRAVLATQREFVIDLVTSNAAVAFALAGMLVWFLLRVTRRGHAEDVALAIALPVTLVGSVAVNVHANSMFVPLAFLAVAVPQVLSAAEARSHVTGLTVAIGAAVLAVTACVRPFAESVTDYRMFRHPRSVTCYNLTTMKGVKTEKNVTMMFAETAGYQPILSVGRLFAARTSYVSRAPMRHPFQIDYYLYTDKMGASEIQARYLQERTFGYVWIHIDKFDRFHDIEGQIEDKTYGVGAAQTTQRAALAANYVPVLSCRNDVLLRSR
jgi:dolichyl-phosphate-mannose-protein mannosyltransferase